MARRQVFSGRSWSPRLATSPDSSHCLSASASARGTRTADFGSKFERRSGERRRYCSDSARLARTRSQKDFVTIVGEFVARRARAPRPRASEDAHLRRVTTRVRGSSARASTPSQSTSQSTSYILHKSRYTTFAHGKTRHRHPRNGTQFLNCGTSNRRFTTRARHKSSASC